MELSSEVFTCHRVDYGQRVDYKDDLNNDPPRPWLAYWFIQTPQGAAMMQITSGWTFDPVIPKPGDTKTPAQMGFRKWGYQGEQNK